MSIIAPCDALEMKALMKQTVNYKKPLYIRLAKGGDKIITKNEEKIKIGKGVIKIKPKPIWKNPAKKPSNKSCVETVIFEEIL